MSGYDGTKAVNLWLTNDEGHVRELAEQYLADGDVDSATYDLAFILEAEHSEANPLEDEDIPSVFTVLLRGALKEVNWHEIARRFVEDAAS